ncbi:MAG: hypothetical protein A2048_05820 [Deltaproteobacteria bacterium GWA2_45_12]|nr:MAG: hypothetical protein A2048_05820 [Deltaproteobacteria bacterium GWA2_45_12]
MKGDLDNLFMNLVRQKYLVLIVAIFLSACSTQRTKPTLEYMPNMIDSPAVKAQEQIMRLPPEGTNPIGFERYPFTINEGDKAMGLVNPLPMTKAVLKDGKKLYDTYCIVCHGPEGKGNGTIVPKFPMPPSLHSEKVKNWPDGRLFHVMTTGQNLMPAYASQIFPKERWAIAKYVRVLQRAVMPTEEDTALFEKIVKGKP